MTHLVERSLGTGLAALTRLVTGAQARWLDCAPAVAQRIYYGNHSSHADFALIWASLPPELRRRTRPVAAADYWSVGPIRSYLIHNVLHGVLVERAGAKPSGDPIESMVQALDNGDSLILFPEGTRNTSEQRLLPFKSGIYRLALQRPAIEIVPVWMENLGRVLPKGELIPVPLLCSINFGAPLRVLPGESRDDFLSRARAALLELGERVAPR
jgi:1-acyl-sn-glycerol-3-phosphate acyltransferase